MKDDKYATQKILLKSIGRCYRDSKRRMDLCEMEHTVQRNLSQYRNDASFVGYIDRVLKDCDERTRLIIRNEYLQKPKQDWYEGIYSKSAYYRNKKIAVKQFDQVLNSSDAHRAANTRPL